MGPNPGEADGPWPQWDSEKVPPPPEPGRSRRLIPAVVAAGVFAFLLLVAGVLVAVRSGTQHETAIETFQDATTQAPQPTSLVPSAAPGQHAPTQTAMAGEAQLADDNFFVSLHPELRTMPAPGWVTQGLRITYYSAAASVPGSYHRYVEDENGDWVDPDSGDRYRREDIPGAAGHGYNQITVTALNDAVAALSIHVFGLTDIPKTSPVTTLTWGGAVGYPAAGADYWLSPEVLAQVDEVVSSDLKVLRMPYAIDEYRFDALWIQTLGDTGNFTWVYDLDSGILLHTASSTQGPPITGPVAQGEGREGSTFLTNSELVDVRQLQLPWVDDPAPTWIDSTSTLQYSGGFSVNTLGSTTNLDLGLQVDRVSSGTDWARYRFAQTIFSTVAPSVTQYMERVDGSGQVAALFIPTEQLAELQEGQVLDTDPVTGMVVDVAAVQQSADGFTVTIREAGPAEVSQLVYDGQSGVLLASSHQDLRINTETAFQLASAS